MLASRKAPVWFMLILFLVVALLWLPNLVMLFNSVSNFESGLLFYFWQVFEDSQLTQSLGLSFQIAVASSVLSTILSLVASIAIYRTDFPLKKWLMQMTSMSLLIPELVLALSLLALFATLQAGLGLTTVLLSHMSFSLPFSIFIIGTGLAQLDQDIERAAEDLGSTAFQVFGKIIFPQLVPIIGISAVLCFLLSFDDFLITFFVNGVGTDTLPIKLFSAMRMGHSPQLSALSVMITLVTVILVGHVLARIRALAKSGD